MQPGPNLPVWAMTIPVPVAQGTNPPAAPVTMQAGLSEPDAAGHQWVILMLGDGTVGVTMRCPWQSAPGFGKAIADALQGLADQAAAKQGPQLIVPQAGVDLDLDILRRRNGTNGHKP